MIGQTTRRLVLDTVTVLLIFGGFLAGVGGGVATWRSLDGAPWWGVPVAVCVGLLAALGSWLFAALIGLAIEIADSLRALAAR